MEGEDISPELDKSFCIEKNSSDSNIELDSPTLNFKKEDVIYFSDDDFSACLIPNMNTNNKKINDLNFSSPSSNELNIFDSTDPKYILRPHFFRLITKSHCDPSYEEERNMIDRIFYFNRQSLKLKDNKIEKIVYEKEEDKYFVMNSNNSVKGVNNNYNINNVNIKVSISNKNQCTIEEDLNESEYYNFEKNINNDKGSEFKLFEKNKMRYSNLNSAAFNVLVVGVKDIGKTSFIKYFLKRLKNSMEIQKNNNKNSSISGTNSKIYKGNSKYTLSYYKDSASDSFFDSSNNLQSSTMRFKKYKLRCVSLSNNKENALYDINMIDSPGYDKANSKRWLHDITKYIQNHYQEYFNKKENPQRLKETEYNKVTDCRIHLCLYFLNSNLTGDDLVAMREISKLTNLIPIVGKGDRLSDEQILNLKSQIMVEGKENNIQFMDLYAALNKLCKDPLKVNYLLGGNYGFCPPFLVCLHCTYNHSSDSMYDLNQTDNEEKSDLSRLYLILTCEFMLLIVIYLAFIPFECVEKTKKFYYKNFKKNLQLKSRKDEDKKFTKLKLAAGVFGPLIGLGLYFAFNKKKGEN